MKILILALALPALVFGAGDLESKIDEVVRQHQDTKESGIAIAVLRDREIIFEKGYGERDRNAHLPVDTQTQFGVASTTKAFASTWLAQQAHDHRVDLDKPINQNTFGFSLKLKDAAVTQAITLRDMLSHRTGLPRHDLAWILTQFSTQDLLQRLAHFSFNSDPEMGYLKAWQYNNLMYMAAGALSGQIEGLTWEALAQKNLLEPLGIKTATFDVPATQATGNFARGYYGEQEVPLLSLASVAAAGTLNASIHDMALWTQMHLKRGLNAEGKRVVAAQALEDTYRPNIAIPGIMYDFLPKGQRWEYGMGWFVGELGGERLIAHGGNAVGITTIVAFLPERGLGLVVVTNQNGSVFPAKAASEIFQFLTASNGDVSPYLSVLNLIERGMPPTAPGKPSGASPCVGKFRDSGYGDLEMTTDRFVYYKNSWPFELGAGNTFHVAGSMWGMPFGLPGKFLLDQKGNCLAVEAQFEASAENIRFGRL